MLHAHAQSFFQALALVSFLVKLPSFRPSQSLFKFVNAVPSQSMFKFINAEITQKTRAKRVREKNKSYLTLYVTFVVFLDRNFTYLK